VQILNNTELYGKQSCIVRKNILWGLNGGLFECIISAFSWRKWREVQKTSIRLFDDPNLQSASEGDYAHLYSKCQVVQCVDCPMPKFSSVTWCLDIGAVVPPNLEKRLLFIIHMNKVINKFIWQYEANFSAFQEPHHSTQNKLTSWYC
jgi:hypothetical protein